MDHLNSSSEKLYEKFTLTIKSSIKIWTQNDSWVMNYTIFYPLGKLCCGVMPHKRISLKIAVFVDYA